MPGDFSIISNPSPLLLYPGRSLYLSLTLKADSDFPTGALNPSYEATGLTATFPDAQSNPPWIWLTSGGVASLAVKVTCPADALEGDKSIRIKVGRGNVQHSIDLPVKISRFSTVPLLDKWIANAQQYGEKYSAPAYLAANPSGWQGGSWYYDGGRACYDLGDYFEGGVWYERAERILVDWRDRYVLPNNGRVPGYNVFTGGLLQHYYRKGDKDSLTAISLLAKNAAYNVPSTSLGSILPTGAIREVSYAIQAQLDLYAAGGNLPPKTESYVDILLGHIQQMCILRNVAYVQPFMLALAAEALTGWNATNTNDPRILPHVKAIADYLICPAWVEADQSWWYESNSTEKYPTVGAPDLNLLILPLLCWVHQRTGDRRYIDLADKAFACGVQKAYLGSGKHWAQNYRWSTDYVLYRRGQ